MISHRAGGPDTANHPSLVTVPSQGYRIKIEPWSSSSYAPAATDAWLVGFDLGGVSYADKTLARNVRCVRAGP